MYQKNLDVVYKDVSAVLTKEIRSKGLWEDFSSKADENKILTYQNFEEIVREIIIDIDNDEMIALKTKLFPQGAISLSDLAKALRINVLDQKKKKTVMVQKLDTDRQQEEGQPTIFSIPQPELQQQKSQQNIITTDKKVFTRQHLQVFSQDNNYKDQITSQAEQQQQQQQQQQNQQEEEEEDAEVQGPQHSQPVRFQKEATDKKEPSLDEQIEDLFNSIDSNANGWLDPKELNMALLQLGINPTPQELEMYFKKFDKNNDEKISKLEFNIIIKDQLMKAILCTDDLFALIQSEYNILTDANRNELDMAQLQQVFRKLGIFLDNNDLCDLFDEIDEDGSGFIEQDELINFLDKPFSDQTPKSQTLLTKINNFKGLSIVGIRELFQGIPKNFTYSFIFSQNKKGLNTLSSCFSPKIDSSGLLYQDLNLIQAQKYNLTRSLIDMTQTPPLVFYEIKFHLAAGLPSPDDKKCDLKSFKIREVALCLFDKVNSTFIGNTVFVPSQVDPASPDKWLFTENPVILRCVPQKQDQQISLIIEFIAHMEKAGTLNPLSVSYGEVLLTSIKKPGKQIIQMNGGSPYNSMVIDPQSIIQPKGLFKKQLNQPQLTIEFLTIELKKPQIIQLFSVLPQTYILPRNWLQLMHDFREYFAYRSVCKGYFDSQLPDFKMKCLLDILNMPECGDIIANWWIQNIKPQNFQETIATVDLLCQRAYLTCQREDFYLKQYPIVQRINHKPQVLERRRACLQDMFRDILFVQGKRGMSRKPDSYFNLEPLLLNALQEDNDKQALEKILNRKGIK